MSSLNLLLSLRRSLMLMPSPMWGLIPIIVSAHKRVSNVTALHAQVPLLSALFVQFGCTLGARQTALQGGVHFVLNSSLCMHVCMVLMFVCLSLSTIG